MKTMAKLFVLCLSLSHFGAVFAREVQRPNVLFIAVDENAEATLT